MRRQMVGYNASMLLLVGIATLILSNTQYNEVNAFAPSSGSSTLKSSSMRQATHSPEEAAKAMTDYMAKSHEEKLKAIQQATAQKDAEIKVSFVYAPVRTASEPFFTHFYHLKWKTIYEK